MVDSVLVAYDGSEQSEHALEWAIEEHADATVTLLYVIDPVEGGYAAQPPGFGGVEEWFERAREDAESVVADAAERATSAGVETETAVEVGRPARTVVEYAEDHDIEQVVVGSHGREGVSRILLGSVAESIVRRSPVPVTVVR